MLLGPVFYGYVGRTRIIARCFWGFFMILCSPVFMTMLVLMTYACVRSYLVLSINFLVVSVICSSLSILKEGLNTT